MQKVLIAEKEPEVREHYASLVKALGHMQALKTAQKSIPEVSTSPPASPESGPINLD